MIDAFRSLLLLIWINNRHIDNGLFWRKVMSVNFYFGKTGSGKSFRANLQIKKYLKRIIYDPTPSKSFTGSFETSNYSKTNLIQMLHSFAGKKEFSIVFRPNDSISMYDQAEIVAFFSMQLGKCFKMTQNEFEGIAVVFDELDKYVTTKQDSKIGKLAGMGRHYNCHLHCISQVPSKLPKSLRDNAYNIYAFPLAINSFYTEKLGDSKSNLLAGTNFPKYSCIHWNDEKGISFIDKQGKVKNVVDKS